MTASRGTTLFCWHCKGESKCDCISCAVPNGKGQRISGQCVVCCRREIVERLRSANGGLVDLSGFHDQARSLALAALRMEGDSRRARVHEINIKFRFKIKSREVRKGAETVKLYRLVRIPTEAESQSNRPMVTWMTTNTKRF